MEKLPQISPLQSSGSHKNGNPKNKGDGLSLFNILMLKKYVRHIKDF
jgi:hypothetical protein